MLATKRYQAWYRYVFCRTAIFGTLFVALALSLYAYSRIALVMYAKRPSARPEAEASSRAVERALAVRGDSIYRDSYAQSASEFLADTQSLLDGISDGISDDPTESPRPFSRSAIWTENPKHNSTVEIEYALHNACASSSDAARRLRIMVVCGIHGRELFSSDVCRSWMLLSAMASESLPRGSCEYDSEERVAPIDWMYVQVANPSGRDLASAAYSSSGGGGEEEDGGSGWNKCHRGNSRGVDLNRNWRTYDLDLYSGPGKQAGERRHRLEDRPVLTEEYSGPESFSEAEALALRTLLDRFEPDVLLSVHTGMYSITYPYDDSVRPPETRADLMRFASMASEWAACRSARPRCSVGQGSNVLPVSRGTMGDFAYRHRKCPFPLTLEAFEGPHPRDFSSWDGDPDSCFYFFNPHQSAVLASLKRWKPLWKGLYHMDPSKQSLIRTMSDDFRREGL